MGAGARGLMELDRCKEHPKAKELRERTVSITSGGPTRIFILENGTLRKEYASMNAAAVIRKPGQKE